ncbi:MAG: phosphoribosylformylglycinamidine cyclo-ligase [Acidimicrobiia bacterium]|nr:phosphoribosylformylglycinamidine cyclo-ligase [Acidimicrobiia bacterium]
MSDDSDGPDDSDGADRPLTYRAAGVDIGAGEKAVELIKEHVRSTFRPEVVGDIGGFGGLFALDWRSYRDPLLVSSTDGVGTKSLIAQLTGRRDTIGIDLVAMSVDDIAVQGAEPLFFLDYISVGKLVPEEVDDIVAGVAEGCRQARCALLGGEMSEHPGIMEPGEFDLVGFAVGVVERSRVLPSGVRAGDRIVGFGSPGLRCNGYSLARAALLEQAGRRLDDRAWAGAHHDLADELLRPSVIYAPAMQTLTRHVEVHAFAHITGGGIPGNLERVLPERCDGIVRRGGWEEPRIFGEIQSAGMIPDAEMEQVFNLGLGMLAVVPSGDELKAVDAIRVAGHDAWMVGEIVTGTGKAHVER